MAPSGAEPIDTLRTLIREQAVEYGEFELSSGGTSSVYVDIRQVSLTGVGADLIGRLVWSRIADRQPDAIGGMTLGADPLVTATTCAAYAEGTDLSGVLVRKASKDHGTEQRIEAPDRLEAGADVVAIDDTTTTGRSTLEAVEQMRDYGFEVEVAISILDRESGARSRLADAGVDLRPLLELSDVADDP